jgi:hypothetical protein
MTKPTRQQQLAWMAQWRSAAIALAQVRAQELAVADLARIASDLDEVCIEAARTRGLAPTSGLVIQQRIFQLAAQR